MKTVNGKKPSSIEELVEGSPEDVKQAFKGFVFMQSLEVLDWAARRADHIKELFDNDQFGIDSVTREPWAITYLSQRLQQDTNIVLKAIKGDRRILEDKDPDDPTTIAYVWKQWCIGNRLQTRQEALEAIEEGHAVDFFRFIDFFGNKEIATELVKADPRSLDYLEPTLRSDKELVLIGLHHDHSTLWYADPSIQELCKDKDPIEALEAAIRKEKFQAALPDKPAVKRKKTF